MAKKEGEWRMYRGLTVDGIAKKLDKVEMVDGRVYLSPDNWATVYIKRGGKFRLVTDKDEADRARYIAVVQSSAGRY